MEITNEQITEAKNALLALTPRFARKVAPVFQLLDYTWGKDDKEYVPDVDDIKRTLGHLIGELNQDLLSLSTGRLVAEIKDGEAYIRMEISEDYLF